MNISGRRFIECCCTDAGEATAAQDGGARRVELCEDLACGGVTPSEENIKSTLSSVSLPVNVLIRPRGGNFVYDEAEKQKMLDSVRLCRNLGVNGVVIGALDSQGNVDREIIGRLMAEAGSLHVTFHRAFDECSDPFKALEDIISLGCERLLTAGHAQDVSQGAKMLKSLAEAAGDRIVIMAGSGVRPWNISELEQLTHLKEYHSSAHGKEGRTSKETVSLLVNTGRN